MKKIIEYLKEVKNIYLYLIILFLVVVCIILSVLFITKKEEVNNYPVLESNEIDKESVIEEVKNIKVDIKGNVLNPGVYELNSNSRVIDAINMAGGLLENSDTSLINLSQTLTDEMTIIIYSKEQIETYKASKKEIEYVYIEVEKCPDKINDACINKDDSTKNQTTSESDDKNEEKNQEEIINETESNTSSLISLNSATIEDLKTLSGIGDSKAKAIIEYRKQNGNFNSIEEIKNVSGIGDSLFEKIKDTITI